MNYKHLFPEEFLDAFETGFDLIAPLAITVKETEPNLFPQAFIDASEKNRGKYQLDAEGYIVVDSWAEISGLPFPDVDPGDKDLATKLMWNRDYMYLSDSVVAPFYQYGKRRAEGTIGLDKITGHIVYFQNRMFDDPKPLMPSKTGLRYANFIRNLYPSIQRNFITNLWRYIDQRKSDVTYVYIPSLRRVLRAEAGERSTPILNSTQAPDDFNGGWDARIGEHTYKYLGERKVLGVANAQLTLEDVKDLTDVEVIPMETDNWEIREVHVIETTAKDSKYPQSKKVLWMDKTNYLIYNAAAWDRAGKLWKVWQTPIRKWDSASGVTIPYMTGMIGMDIQMGYATQMIADFQFNGHDLTESDIDLAAMRKVGR
jgi:hypothetical protein